MSAFHLVGGEAAAVVRGNRRRSFQTNPGLIKIRSSGLLVTRAFAGNGGLPGGETTTVVMIGVSVGAAFFASSALFPAAWRAKGSEGFRSKGSMGIFDPPG